MEQVPNNTNPEAPRTPDFGDKDFVLNPDGSLGKPEDQDWEARREN
jgi:hypothetical protein